MTNEPIVVTQAKAPIIKGIILIVALTIVLILAFESGRHVERKLTYFSELGERTQGRKTYLIDMEVVCNNGKDIGKLQVDLNLRNGKLAIVRNDNQLEPNCVK